MIAQWIITNWLEISIPVLVIIACYAIGLWVRRLADNAFSGWILSVDWDGGQLVAETIRRPFIMWFLLAGMAIAVQVSILPPQFKSIAGRAIGSLFVLSLGWLAITMVEQMVGYYLPKIKAPHPAASLTKNAVRITVIIISALVMLDIWGIPTTPLLVLIATAVLGVMLSLRNITPDLFARFQLEATQQIKVGDQVKLEMGEQGQVVEINWNNTYIRTEDGNTVIVPNNWLLQHTVINYGNSTLKEGGSKSQETKAALSEREKEIALLIAEGISNKEIAQRLFIAENTVKVHVKNILRKLEMRNRQQLAAYTALQGWASEDDKAEEGNTA